MSSQGKNSDHKRNLLDEMEEQEERLAQDDTDSSIDAGLVFSESMDVDDDEGSSSLYDSSTLATSEGDLFEGEEDEDDEDQVEESNGQRVVEYEWTPEAREGDEGDRKSSALSLSEDQSGSPPSSGVSFEVAQGTFPGSNSFGSEPPRRSSLRRASYSSVDSAGDAEQKSKRRITISVPGDDMPGDLPSSNRTSVARRTSIREVSKQPPHPASSGGKGRTGLLKNLKSHISFRRSGNKTPSTSDLTMDNAASSLGRSAQNAHWGDVAAAAAVVAADTAPKQRIQFFVGDNILAFLNILNHTNLDDPPETFSIDPVNKFGYPPGEGRTNQEQRGPYSYVLATVRRVHFDEDLPYYTVVRADTLTEQRCEAAWMEPLTDSDGAEAALRAAQRTGLSAEDDVETTENLGIFVTFGLWLLGVETWFGDCFNTRVVPFYQRTRYAAKDQVGHMLYGDRPFACRMRFTGVNMLVWCSFVFLFIEQVVLAFVPARMDYAFVIVALIVWCILILELILEWLIRPSRYFHLIESDKAFAPSTQRYIDSFHLCFEMIALLLFIPEFLCLSSKEDCGNIHRWTGIRSALLGVVGDTKRQAFVGRLYLGLTVLRIFGLIRHWRNMWLANAFNEGIQRKGRLRNLFLPVVPDTADYVRRTWTRGRHKKAKVEDETTLESVRALSDDTSEEDRRLKKAATIGTALMVINSHRALSLLTATAILLPLLISYGGTNQVFQKSVELLYANNVAIPGSDEASCSFLNETIFAWILATPIIEPKYRTDTGYSRLLWAQVLPVRCEFQRADGVITVCPEGFSSQTCEVWDSRPENPEDATPEYYAKRLDLRVGGITERNLRSRPGPGSDRSLALPGPITLPPVSNDPLVDVSVGGDFPELLQDVPGVEFSVTVIFDQNSTIGHTHLWLLCNNALFLVLCLFGLGILRGDADRLVLDPLQRMLKIVVRYAENPLSQTPTASRSVVRKKASSLSANEDEDEDEYDDEQQLGNYETEQLINAISKITDLLRKCWGVAGAGIISSNLARMTDGKTVGFNPTVPGKRVYALFGFVAIDGFSEQLRVLDADVIYLINDVAKVVHDEVYRWSLGDSGQCNKNLGSAFLMVFRIGDFTEVHEKKAKATDVVFSSSQARKGKRAGMRRNGPGSSKGLRRRRSVRSLRGEPDDTLQLASLPGIQTFSDRALLGMLKSFAGIYRDKSLLRWKNDFRLSAGVGAFGGVSLVYGMDAGWAVEGAVGSAFKIDATYLSPHVNMASRMMSASKQYGVHILLSQAVEEILSAPARAKLRHLDTVYVKGSSVAQRVYTFDARSHGVDFFLYERTDEQEDLDAELYSPAIWNTDQDIRAMRQHVTKEFEKKYKEGKDHYLRGKWTEAVASLTAADDIMIRTQLEEGYIDYNPDEIDGRIFNRKNQDEELVRIRHELGDGACRCLIAYMERRKCKPPNNWKGVRPLTSK